MKQNLALALRIEDGNSVLKQTVATRIMRHCLENSISFHYEPEPEDGHAFYLKSGDDLNGRVKQIVQLAGQTLHSGFKVTFSFPVKVAGELPLVTVEMTGHNFGPGWEILTDGTPNPRRQMLAPIVEQYIDPREEKSC